MLIPGYDQWLDAPIERDYDERELNARDEDEEPQSCEVARAFAENQIEMVNNLEANDRRKADRRIA